MALVINGRRILTMMVTGLLALAVGSHAGTVVKATHTSQVLGMVDTYYVYLPAGYAQQAQAGKKFSVVYLLHWLQYYAAGWHTTDGDRVNPRMDQCIDSVSGIIAVAANNYKGNCWWLNSPGTGQRWTDYLVTDLKGEIDARYATVTDRKHTGICGASMGGYGALHNARIHPEIYGAAYSIQGLIDFSLHQSQFAIDGILGPYNASTYAPFDIKTNYASFKTANVALGFYTSNDDFFRPENETLDATLTEQGVPHEFELLSGPHEMPTPERMVKVLRFFQAHFGPVSVAGDFLGAPPQSAGSGMTAKTHPSVEFRGVTGGAGPSSRATMRLDGKTTGSVVRPGSAVTIRR